MENEYKHSFEENISFNFNFYAFNKLFRIDFFQFINCSMEHYANYTEYFDDII